MDDDLTQLALRLTGVPGVVAVALGGSRARGDHTSESDVDLGLYYRPPLDVEALGVLAREVSAPDAQVTMIGEWGPWVDGGGWLTIGGTAVDWLYRDVDRVRRSWLGAREGRHDWHAQVGHPLGIPGFWYAGELALGRVLADPTGELTALRDETRDYPPALTAAVVRAGLWEAEFCVSIARKAVVRADAAFVAGCLFRVALLCAHALHARAGQWLINEKGAVTAAGSLPGAPAGFAERSHDVVGSVGTHPRQLADAIDRAAGIVAETIAVCRM
jgi:hypothetical protein